MIRVPLSLLGILLSAGLAAAGPVVFVSPRAGETLQGGQIVEVRFEGVPENVDEMELLLTAGPDRAISFRLTEMLDPTTRSYRWAVPNLVLPQATLILRMGEDELEAESSPSDPFAIEPSPTPTLARLDFRHGELWVSDGAGEASVSYALPGMAMSPSKESLRRRRGRAKILIPSPLSGDPGLTECGFAAPAGADPSSVTSQPGTRSRMPRDVPRRI